MRRTMASDKLPVPWMLRIVMLAVLAAVTRPLSKYEPNVPVAT